MKTKPPLPPSHSGRGVSQRRKGSPTRWKRTLQSRVERGYLRSLSAGLLNLSLSRPETPTVSEASEPNLESGGELDASLSKECHTEEKGEGDNEDGKSSTPKFGSTATPESPLGQGLELTDPFRRTIEIPLTKGKGDNEDGKTSTPTDPFRRPIEIPLTTGMFVYPHSASAISSAFQDRFGEVRNYFRRNTESHPELRAHVEHIEYVLKMCGPSVGDSHPSIIAFCRPSEFKALRSLLNEKHLKRQWCRRRTSPPYLFWKNWGKDDAASNLETSDHKPLFNLYFWQTAQPRNFLCLESTQMSLWTETASPLTLSGASMSIEHSGGQGVSRSTVAGVLQIDDSFYALTAAHGIRKGSCMPKNGLDGCSLSPSLQMAEQAIDIDTSDKMLSTHGLLRGNNQSGGDDDGDDFVSDIEYEDAHEPSSAKGQLERDRASLTSMPELENDVKRPNMIFKASWICPKSRNLPDFDWAVAKLDSEDLIRPNALINVNSTQSHEKSLYFWDMASNLPVRETAVLIHTANGIQKAMLQTATACLGAINYNSRVQAQYWTLIMCEGSSLSHGDSGSVVVDAVTHSVYGHVVASNPLGEIYISPITKTVDQIQESLSADKVALPEPLAAVTKLACHYLEHQRDEAFQILTELNELIKYSNRSGISRRQIGSWERSTARHTLSLMASITISRARGAKAERTKILRRFILESHLGLSNLRDASPPGGFPPQAIRSGTSGTTASTPSPPPSPSPTDRPDGAARHVNSDEENDQRQSRLGQSQFHSRSVSFNAAVEELSVVERDSRGSKRVEAISSGENIDAIRVRALPAPAETRPRRNSMEEDYFYRDLMTSRPRDPPSYQAAMREALREELNGRKLLSVRDMGNSSGIGDVGNPPPEYKCEIHLEGVFMRKMEIENVSKRAEYRGWSMVYVELHGTGLSIYNVKKERGWWSAKHRSRDISPDSPPWVKKGTVEKVYNLAHAEVGIAADYKKRRYVMRLRLEDDQFMLSCVELSTLVTWLDQLLAAFEVTAPIDERDFPFDYSIPRIQRIRWLRGHSRPIQYSTNVNEDGAAGESDEDDEDGRHEPHLASQQILGRLTTGTSQPNENIDPGTGKWEPRHRWTTRHDQLYAKLCYRVLLFKSPRKSNYIVRQGKRWYVDWMTGRMVRVHPPRYDDTEILRGP